MTDTDRLPPTQHLIGEVLAARHRLGETIWPFPDMCRRAANALADRGLIDIIDGNVERSFRARLTAAGRAEFMPASGYQTPAERDRNPITRVCIMTVWHSTRAIPCGHYIVDGSCVRHGDVTPDHTRPF